MGMARTWTKPLQRAAAALSVVGLGACMSPAEPPGTAQPADARRGELAARPRPAASAQAIAASGLSEIATTGEAALLYVPPSYAPNRPAPLVVMLHGAGGTPRHSIDLAQAEADRLGLVLLAPGSQAPTWDIIAARRYGPDVRAIDEALTQVFVRYAIDGRRVAIGGFSDGASYALSLGLANGDLFRDVVAFSPGFMAPARRQGSPRIFISHGVQDRVLPIERCSRRLAPQLGSEGYDVRYREFPGGHIVPAELAREAFAALAAGT